MGYYYKNENPDNKFVDDCIIRAIATATDKSWDDIYWELSVQGYKDKDKLDGNTVWGSYLIHHGFQAHRLPDTCPFCYTVKDFVRDNPHGIYLVGDGAHLVAVVDGFYIDNWDSGDRTVLFYFEKQRFSHQ